MNRREFSRSVRVEIVRRATRNGIILCEQCGCLAKKFEIDHTDPDALQIDKTRRLTADDGKLLCSGSPDSCHSRKTAVDRKNIARAQAREAAHLHVRTRPVAELKSPGFARSTRSIERGKREPKPKAVGISAIARRYQ